MRRFLPKIPKGFEIKIKKDIWNDMLVLLCDKSAKSENIIFSLKKYKNIKIVGCVWLTSNKSKTRYSTHSELCDKYHNRGLGLLMYIYAINYALKKGWRVSSSGYSSTAAQNVWKSKRLRKYFYIKKKSRERQCFDKWYVKGFKRLK